MPKKRVQFEISNDAWEELKEIRELANIPTNAELFRRAVRLYQFLLKKQKEGATVIVRPAEEEEDLAIVGF